MGTTPGMTPGATRGATAGATRVTETERGEQRNARLASLRYSSVWLVFLAIPAILVALTSDAGPFWDWIAYGALAAFGAVYLCGFVFVPREEMLSESNPWPRWGWFVLILLALVALAALMLPALGLNVFALSPYFAGYGLFLLPLRPGLVWFALVAVVTGGLVWLILGHVDFGAVTGPVIANSFVVIVRLVFAWTATEERTRVELAAVQERAEVSRDVHDILGHTLTVIALKTQLARRTLREDPARAETELDEVLAHTQTALDEVRATVGRLRTPELAAQLAAAKTALATKDIRLVVRGSSDDVAVEHRALFAWAIREGVTNIVRHSGATTCTVTLSRHALVVHDDGIGMAAAEGNGLSGLRRRTEDAGGKLTLEGVDGRGTTLEVRFA
ncbi:sensor histidine kinase [Gulosibacter molinativorax]|uniref:Two-component sensor histidine kinase n=1 Tax=Gulosibacter molinativorax TaxID=256821 RepID=A0ABT7C481_9MICO|nr:histidine kinase [Gulosibacter molinativorax]MDJ1369958.1 two-component sensor histidine kinase [Gulosibacter molinativorax]QUY63853.1 Histidine kinase [Gulosibacter molinativorax]